MLTILDINDRKEDQDNDDSIFSRGFDEIPLLMTETDVWIPSEDEEEERNVKSINSFNISAWGKLRFNRYSQSNISTNLDSNLSANHMKKSSSKMSVLKDFIGMNLVHLMHCIFI